MASLFICLHLLFHVKTFKVEEKNRMSFHIDDEKLLGKYKVIWIKIEDLIKY